MSGTTNDPVEDPAEVGEQGVHPDKADLPDNDPFDPPHERRPNAPPDGPEPDVAPP